MSNISLRGEDVLLTSDSSYCIIDALYLSRIKEEINSLDLNDWDREVRQKVFPYTSTPFAMIEFGKSEDKLIKLNIRRIKRQIEGQNDPTTFSSDTGLLLIINRTIFIDFASYFDYDEIVDGGVDLINKTYWNNLEQNFGKYNCALILSPGVTSGLDFDGSGLYRVE